MRLLFIVALFLFPFSAISHTLQFNDACIKGDTLTIAAVGDVLLHYPLQKKASQAGFQSLWREALPYINQASIAYANLEGPIATGINENGRLVNNPNAWDFRVYTSYPAFNYHPSLAGSLRHSGFDIVSTANNHALDRSAIGIDKTIANLDAAGLLFNGTKTRNAHQFTPTIVNKNNWKVAWIACTGMTNGITDSYHQVLHCFKKSDHDWILQTIAKLKHQVDAIIITPHWGEEYQQTPSGLQKKFAHEVLEMGATAVIGSHPHVLQPFEKYLTKDGRSTLIAYSLGNFVSYQSGTAKRSTIILFLGLTKRQGQVVINGVRYVPMYMQNHSQRLALSCLTKENSVYALSGIERILPAGNMMTTSQVITNPECQ